MDWKNLFDKQILERGFGYYLEGAVGNIDISENSICAKVAGSELYVVEINTENDEITDMHCSCPYAKDGHNCKHMAAVLYKCEDNADMDKPDKVAFTTAAELVSTADEGIVRKFLAEILDEDIRLYMKFKNMVSTQISKADIDNLKNQIDHILFNNTDRYGDIHYNSAWDFCCELADFADDNIPILIDRNYLEEAADLIIHIYNLFSDIYIDDSDGGASLVSTACHDKLEDIISRADMATKTKVYSRLKDCLDKSLMDFFADDIEELLFDKFYEDEFVKANLELTDKKLIEAENIANNWSRHYIAGQWFAKHIELMNKQGAGFDEILEYLKKHWHLKEARKLCIEVYCNQKEYDKSIEILLESIELDKNYYGTVSDYKYKLKDIYKEAGYNEKYIELLWELTVDRSDIVLYRELKSLYSSKEWSEKREILFNKLSNNPFVAKIYLEEKIYDRLLNYVLQSESLYELSAYANVLSELYPDELLKKYKTEIEKIATHTADRKQYKQWVNMLRRMKKIKGGNEVVYEIVSEWRKIYARRKALIDELNHL